MYINATALMMAMLDYSEINIEVSDVGIKTVKSDNCKEVLKDDEDANGMLVIIQERARFSHKDE